LKQKNVQSCRKNVQVAPRAGHTKGGRFAHSDRDLQLDPIVRRVHEILLRAEIPFSRLN
jgi:hypothetical protein